MQTARGHLVSLAHIFFMGRALMEGAGVFTPFTSLLVDLCSFNFLAVAGAIRTSSSDIKIGVLSSIEANFPRKMVVLGIAHTGLPSVIQSPELEGLEKNAHLSVLL